jgi:hypothetical protein
LKSGLRRDTFEVQPGNGRFGAFEDHFSGGVKSFV